MRYKGIINALLATNTFETEKRSPLTAAAAGFLFGAFGLGFYLRSWYVFFFTFWLLVGAASVVPLHLLVWALVAGVWGALAVHWANRQRHQYTRQGRLAAADSRQVTSLCESVDDNRVTTLRELPTRGITRREATS
jgi:hypothetical protein